MNSQTITFNIYLKIYCIHREFRRNGTKTYDYAVSQWTVYYNLDPCHLDRKAKLFAAFLMNHKWKDFEVLKTVKEIDPATGNIVRIKERKKYASNLGWYAGIAIGEVMKEGDWALEMQYVQALAVPGQDVSDVYIFLGPFSWVLST